MTHEEAKEAVELVNALRLVAAIGPPGAERRKMQTEAKALERTLQKVLAN